MNVRSRSELGRPGSARSRGIGARILALGILPLILLGAALLVAISLLFPSVATGAPGAALLIRNAVVFVSLTGMAVAAYIAWPSRWNIPAHLQLAFAIPAYLVPMLGLDWLDSGSAGVSALYVRLVSVGFVVTAVGVLVGRLLIGRFLKSATVARVQKIVRTSADQVRRRVLIITIVSMLGLVVCFAVMGFVPAFADDPNAAKFFKGVYHEPYQAVSIPYRLTTTLIPLFMPLVAVYAWIRRRNVAWLLLVAASVGVMLISLLREPAVSGILLAVGILVAYYKRFRVLYMLLLLASYVAGSAMYGILALLGVEQYQSMVRSPDSFLTGIASGAPDIKDQLALLNAWMPGHELTLGRTFVGGLVPGNFEWNPSVWTLRALNPTTDIEDITSGGLRLPAPIWGYVSFDWWGAILVPLVAAILVGLLAAFAGRIIPRLNLEHAAIVMLAYFAVIEVIPAFYRLSYLTVMGLFFVAILFVPLPKWLRLRREPAMTTETQTTETQ